MPSSSTSSPSDSSTSSSSTTCSLSTLSRCESCCSSSSSTPASSSKGSCSSMVPSGKLSDASSAASSSSTSSCPWLSSWSSLASTETGAGDTSRFLRASSSKSAARLLRAGRSIRGVTPAVDIRSRIKLSGCTSSSPGSILDCREGIEAGAAVALSSSSRSTVSCMPQAAKGEDGDAGEPIARPCPTLKVGEAPHPKAPPLLLGLPVGLNVTTLKVFGDCIGDERAESDREAAGGPLLLGRMLSPGALYACKAMLSMSTMLPMRSNHSKSPLVTAAGRRAPPSASKFENTLSAIQEE
mmetsp:Transcript_47576/g.110933  ORF Transcript_47576/g.110933 Transcript_47576/m.110933 type:complete len:297 (-) Transcript_47576:2834-3724(-)